MSTVTVTGLIVYCAVAGAGLFINRGLSQPLFVYLWLAGYLYLLFRVAYDAYISRENFRPFPLIVLGIILLNFLVQISGGLGSYLWPFYFLYAVVIAAFSPPRRTYGMIAVMIAIESANLLQTLSRADLSARWHVYAGFGLTLAGVSAVASHIMQRSRQEVVQVRDAHDRMLAQAESLDPLTQPARLESLAPENRTASHLRTVRLRQNDFNSLIDMIFGFVPAHTYALFLREPREGDSFALQAIRSESGSAVLPVGTVLDPQKRGLIDVCAEQRQPQYLSDLAAMSMPLHTLGYYREDLREFAVRSYLVLPIVKDGRTIAVLAVDSREPGAFSLETQDMLEKFAPFFLQIIDNIDMSLLLKTRADHFGVLHVMSTELSKSLWFGDTMRAIIPQLRGIVPFDLCACVLAGEQDGGQTLTLAALSGYDATLLGSSFPLSDSTVVGSMWKHWQSQNDQKNLAYYSADLGDRGREISLFPFKELQKPIRSLYGRLLVAKDPLRAESYILRGAVFLASFRPNAFTEYHREILLDTLMNQVSQVAHNSLLYQQIENMARTDGLTGLLNHRTFMEKLQEKKREMERRPHPFSILLMDIDKFKNVNDTYGHPVGDLAIKAVARVLRETVRTTDFVARYGGEEFAVGMIETDIKGAELMAERVRKIMEQTVAARIPGGELKVTLSIGVASFPEDTKNTADLVSMADEALYHAKRSGRNRVCLHRDAAKTPSNS
ncbi:MAG: sensor domain-containing diguanylate cyclase [Nitrospirota bacterium]|nr:sensor domain-containing diguanylate cyclase [Nitrospirota bacterium]